MDWTRLLAYITGSVDQDLLLRNEYLVTENKILRGQIRGRLRLTDGLFPQLNGEQPREGPIQCRERLGGLLKFYHRSAA